MAWNNVLLSFLAKSGGVVASRTAGSGEKTANNALLGLQTTSVADVMLQKLRITKNMKACSQEKLKYCNIF